MILATALNIANEVVEKLKPHCDIINIAGSIRRGKPEVKDIEIVALPKIEACQDLFGPTGKNQRVIGWHNAVSELGLINKGSSNGKYMQIVLEDRFRGFNAKTNIPGFENCQIIEVDQDNKMYGVKVESINLDLFMPDDFDYYRQFTIRTGSADWVTKWIAGGWRKIGWCGTDQGLRLECQCHGETGPDHKKHWKCVVAKAQQMYPPYWKSEEDFFAWLGLKWIEPKLREI